MANRAVIKDSLSDRAFNVFNLMFIFSILVVVLYPLAFLASSSFSDSKAVISGRVWLWPVDPTLDGYVAVFRNDKVWMGYANSLYYVIVGTAVNVFVTICAAYPLSRKDFTGRNFFMLLFTFTMIFNAGLIPNYLLIKSMGMTNSRWALIIPGAMSVYNMIVMRTFFQSNIPDDMLEAAQIDGCGDLHFLIKIVLPLSKPVLAVIVLFYAVSHWNAFFDALIYLSKERLYPLQIVLRNILVQNELSVNMFDDSMQAELNNYRELVKYSLIIVASVPVLCIYPFVQKYFVKGIMVGAIKG